LGIVVVVLVGVTLWIGVRGLLARDALLGAVPLVESVQHDLLEGRTDVADELAEVADRSATAVALTSDPVWRVAEIVPGLGVNLSSFRQAAAVIDDIAADALPPLGELANTLTLDDLVPHDGVFNLDVLVAARPNLQVAGEAMERAATSAATIPIDGTIPQIGEAVDQLVRLVDETAGLVSGLSGAVQILPAMLGQDGPRDYLLLVQNNAELRASGGIPGAVAVIHADQGRLSLGQQAPGASIGRLDQPALPLTDMELGLYSENLGLYMQNVTATPDFARTGELAQAMWRNRYGLDVDGVLSIDPIALAGVLTAIGPVDVGDGVTLTKDNVVQELLSETYARFAEPTEQDAFFQRASAAIFERVVSGAGDARGLVNALVGATTERRVLVWSALPAEEEVISAGAFGGRLPESTKDRTAIGVYFHDNTESKMDYYLQTAIAVGSVECRNDDRPYYEVRVELRSTAPVDAATSLPNYVTGTRYGQGLEKGQIRTTVFVYGAAGTEFYDAALDGRSQAYIAAGDGERNAAGLTVTIDPGETAVVSFFLLGSTNAPLAVDLQHTPTAFEVPTSTDNTLTCPQLPVAPGDGA
jgi:hypothetical protein